MRPSPSPSASRGEPRPGPRALWAWGALFFFLGSLAGCGSVDPGPDYAKAGRLIRERTGVAAAYDPAMGDKEVKARVEALLEGGLTVEEAVAVALLNNPDLQALFFRIGISKADLVQAGLLPNPGIYLSDRWPLGGGRPNVTFGLTQGILDLLLMPSRKRIARARLEEARLEAAEGALALAAEVRRRAYELLGLLEAEKIAGEDLALARRSLDLVKRLKEAGRSRELEVILSSADLMDLQAHLMEIRRDRLLAREKLARLLGISGREKPWKLVGKFPRVSSLPGERELRAAALRRRLDLRVERMKIRAAEEEARREGWKVIPSFGAGFEYERAESPPDLRGPTLEMTLPLWDRNQAGKARALFEVARLRKEYAGLAAEAVREVRSAWLSTRENGKLLEFLEKNTLPFLEKGLERAARSFEAGRCGILELLKLRADLIHQRAKYVRILRAYATSLSDLEYALGGRGTGAADGNGGGTGGKGPQK